MDRAASDGPSTPRAGLLDLVRALAEVAVTDSEYGDVYLRRARALLAPIMSAEALEAARRERGRLRDLRDGAERSLEAGDWHRVHELAVTLRTVERGLEGSEDVVGVAERVYEGDMGIGREALAAQAISPLSASELRTVRARAVAQLEQLATRDPPLRTLYVARRGVVEGLAIERRSDATGEAADTLREQAREALRTGRWDTLASLAEGFSGGSGERGGDCACGPLPEGRLGPDAGMPVAEAATGYGLEAVHLEARDDLRTFLSCRCALAPSLSDQALPPEGRGERGMPCGCQHRCPELEERLRENLDLLKHRGFLTSLGTRYLPVFRSEVVLLETFPEGAEDCGPLLERLGLPRRLGLSRCEIERALVLRGADVIQGLGLDPLEHVLVPVPFDVYLRAAARYGWGERAQWTHLDGYQVLRGWRLRALVGGNARYGGPLDLCSIGRDDPRHGVLARFSVVRRERLQERVGGATAEGPASDRGGRGGR